MAKKEISDAEAEKFIAAYAKKNEISNAEASRKLIKTAISRLRALGTYQDKKGAGKAKRAPKAAKPKAAKKAVKKSAPKKAPAKAAAKVSEGEQG